MATCDLLLRGADVLTPQGLVRTDLAVEGERILALGPASTLPAPAETLEAEGLVAIPGCIDSHVHTREPGYEYKEDWATATRAAAAGGVTMICDMPNLNPVPNTLERYRAQVENAGKKARVDFNSWAMPTVLEEIPGIAAYGACGFKFFMKSAHYPYGTETAIVGHAQILDTFKAVARTGLPCLVHPHNQDIWEVNVRRWTEAGRTGLEAFNEVTFADEDVTETTAIAVLALLARAAGCRLRILHIREKWQIKVCRMLKAAGYTFLCEQNPWAIYDIPAVSLPSDNEDNWAALNDGTIDLIATDHAPHTREESEKAGRNVFDSVVMGYPLVEHYLSMYLTGVNNGRISLERLSRLCSANVARHLGVYPRKGVLQAGSDADIALVDMKARRRLGVDYPVYSKMGHTPIEGMEVQGIPVCTLLRGKVIMRDGEITGEPGCGRYTRPIH